MTADAQDDLELAGLVSKIVRTWESLDIVQVDRFYATDADLAFFDIALLKYPNSGRVSGWRAEDLLRAHPEPRLHGARRPAPPPPGRRRLSDLHLLGRTW